MASRLIAALLVFAAAAQAQERKERKRILFLTHAAGYRHAVVARPAEGGPSLAEKQLVAAAGDEFEIVATQDCSRINPETLGRYAAVVFYTSGELPIPVRALVDYVRGGGGFVGVHSAADTLYGSPSYGAMLGGYYNGRPWHGKEICVRVEEPAHPATAHLGAEFEVEDEIYQFRDFSRDRVHVLLNLDTGSVDMEARGIRRTDRDFALAWCRSFGNGRVFYTALGNDPETWTSEWFHKHLVGGIRWASSGAARDAEGFVTLFDGKSTEGWKQAGPGSFKIENGMAEAVGGMGLWYYEQTFRDFILRVEFQQEDIWHNSGVFVRFPRVDGDPWIPVKEGHEIQIYGDKVAKGGTGSVYTFAAPTKLPLKKAGEWNEYEITCIGPHYRVRLNGELITSYESDRSLTGMVGVQNHNANGKGVVRFKNIRIRELPADAKAYHVLFDGSSRDGWKMCGPGSFELVDGALESRGGMGMLWHEQGFRDFILMLDWRVRRKQDNSGVFVRFPDPGDDPWVAVRQGYELQICDAADPKHRTGSIYSFKDAGDVPTRPVGEWNHYEIQVIGQHYVVRVNGAEVNRFEGSRSATGFVGLQNHDDASRVAFRNIRVIELK